MTRRRRLLFVALGVAVLGFGLVGTAMAVSGRGKVARHVTLAGHNIAGMSRPELTTKVRQIDRELRKAKLKVTAPGGGFTQTLDQLGVTVDVEETVTSALKVGRTGNPIGRMWSALKAWVSERPATIELMIDEGKLRPAVVDHDPGTKTESKEPSLTRKSGVFVAVEGRAGFGIDPDAVIRALPHAVQEGEPLKISVGRGRVPPKYSLNDAEALAREANKLVKTLTLKVTAGEKTVTLESSMIASWIDALPTPEALLLGVSGSRAVGDLAELFPEVGKAVVQTRYGVGSSGQVVVTPGSNGTKCCDEEQVSTLLTAAIRRPPVKPIDLPLRITEPAITADDVTAFAIKEVVGTFTTKHPCCAPRVTNIHRIADIVRGTVIRPHSRLSINTLVGPRTTAKGFVVDHVIEDGKFAEAVGGGISQFATTLFNAAFFAGLDLPEYQSHSIYISRYPYGREATLNYTKPDLVISNNTPYGVLVWPTYTGTSLTVTLYSTEYAPGTQTGQTKQEKTYCDSVLTERTRTYPDGTKKKDHVRATYRHQEGVNCDGSGTPVTTTTRPKSTATTAAPTTSPPTSSPATTSP
jgi:vancomycin resistance protein YoaR